MKKMYNNPTTETVEVLTGNVLVVSFGGDANEGGIDAPARGKGTPIE